MLLFIIHFVRLQFTVLGVSTNKTYIPQILQN